LADPFAWDGRDRAAAGAASFVCGVAAVFATGRAGVSVRTAGTPATVTRSVWSKLRKGEVVGLSESVSGRDCPAGWGWSMMPRRA
jgi:hypothetical protein